MDVTNFLLSIILILLGALGYFLKRNLDKTDIIAVDVGAIKTDLALLNLRVGKVEIEMAEIKPQVLDIKPKVSILWDMQSSGAHSPRTLNENGQRIFKQSRIKEIIDANLGSLSKAMAETNPQNAYQLQQSAEGVVKVTLLAIPGMLLELQDRAYEAGAHVEELFAVGGLYLRDLLLPKYDFKSEFANGQPLSKE